MQTELTQVSDNQYHLIASRSLSPRMAAKHLKEGNLELRKFPDVLLEMYIGDDLMLRLIQAFQEDTPEANPRSVSKKIQNWLNGKSYPQKREDIFHIGFALRLTVPQVNTLLGYCTDYGIHYRESADVVYSWFLQNGKTFFEAQHFLKSLPPIPVREQLIYCTSSSNVTQELRDVFRLVHTEEDLRACYLSNMPLMGHLHFRAYYHFQKYLDLLIHPDAAWGGMKEPDYSIEAVMEQYLTMNMPATRSRGSLTVIQKLLKQNWPSTTSLKNIRLRKEDVPRKLLLLLYVVTENALGDEYDELDEEYVTPEDRLEDHWLTLNVILADCGMPPLDLRNATDWLIFYALAADDEPMSQRMEQVIEYMFADEQNENDNILL